METRFLENGEFVNFVQNRSMKTIVLFSNLIHSLPDHDDVQTLNNKIVYNIYSLLFWANDEYKLMTLVSGVK